nr:hypothetical protein [Tanacetum cinerariifolium]
MCTYLRILDLSRNNLTGSIPRKMANLPLMSASSNPTDDLDEDWLQDLIVNWKKSSQRLRNLYFFVMLDLSGNNISGEIPASLGNLKAIQQLNISHNKISGNIHCQLAIYNMLKGKIPRGRQMDTMNDLSYFQNNSRLCGMQIKVTCPDDIPSPEGRRGSIMDVLGRNMHRFSDWVLLNNLDNELLKQCFYPAKIYNILIS